LKEFDYIRFTKKHYSNLLTVAEKKARTYTLGPKNNESYFTCWRNQNEGAAYKCYLNTPCNTEYDLLKIAGLAYSWMPTMLDLYFPKQYDFNSLLKLIKNAKRMIWMM
jgi:hypothetical protein